MDILDLDDKNKYEAELGSSSVEAAGFSAAKQQEEFLGAGSPEKPERIFPKPEELGFRVVPELDQVGNVDTTNIRKARWEMPLWVAGQDLSNREERQSLVKNLASTSEKQENPEAQELVDLVRSFVGNWESPAALKAVIERGSRDTMQDIMINHAGKIRFEPYPRGSNLGIDGSLAMDIVIALTQEKYGQEHGGVPYQTAAQKAEIEQMHQRAKTTTVR